MICCLSCIQVGKEGGGDETNIDSWDEYNAR